jgi:cysteine synthase A
VEPSFVPGAIDRMMKVPDAAAIASARALERVTGRRAGGSTGTGLWSALRVAGELRAAGRSGSVVALICDPGDRYLDTYYSDAWVAAQGLDLAPYAAVLERFLATGEWREEADGRLSGETPKR